MFPFTLAGPEFLLFYAVLGAAVVLGLVLLRRRQESGEGVRINMTDPYLIACLRGGPQEAVRVATVSLVDRGLLTLQEDRDLATLDPKAVERVRRPMEKSILAWFQTPGRAASVFDSSELKRETAELERSLSSAGLLPDDVMRRARLGRLVLGVAVLWALAFLRVLQAFSRGRHNVLFLVLLAIVLGVVAVAVHNPRRTVRGDDVLADLKSLFSGLRQRATLTLRPGGATADAALLAGVFGIAALPLAEFAFARKLYPKAAVTSSSSSGSSCGSSGSSSGGSSCSSGSSCGSGCGGCGGGGCGG